MITDLLNKWNYGHVKVRLAFRTTNENCEILSFQSSFPNTEPRKSEVVPPMRTIYFDPVKKEVYA